MINDKIQIINLKQLLRQDLDEIKDASSINALCVLDNGKALDISQLAALIKDSSFVVANDTGPAHMTAHLGSKGIALFGSHTTPFKVSIEREKFKAYTSIRVIKTYQQKKFLKNFLRLSLNTFQKSQK
jgi:ADP-heptose:LPS heptosyltransferase